MKFHQILKVSTATAVLGVALASQPAFAQDAVEAAEEAAADSGEPIIVTGSRIVRPNLEANSPIAVLSGEQATQNADVTLDTFLNTLPQVNPAGTTTSNNPGNSGQSNIDLRGLGSNRNLVLVDGRRPMYSGTTTTVGVDLNTIPAALIERIEVITGGAGAAYGADAVSGVVNLILKNNFEGLDVRATYADTIETDAMEFNASAVLGANFSDDRGNAVLAFDYSKREALIKPQRAYAAVASSSTSFLPEGFYNVGANAPTQAAIDAVFLRYGVPAGSVAAGSSGLSFNTDGTLFSPGVNRNPLDVQNFRYPIDSAVNTNFFPDLYSYNFDETNLLVLPLERKSFMGKMDYEVSSFLEPFAQVGWTRYTARTALAPTPVPTVIARNPLDPARAANNTLTSLVQNGQSVVQYLLVPTTNPFIRPDLAQILASRTSDDPTIAGAGPTEPFQLRQRTLGAGARFSNFTNEVIQYLGGLRGEIAPKWRYEAYYSEGRTTIENLGTGAIDTQRLQNMLEAADGGASVCAGGFNPFGRNPLSPECIAYLEVKTRSEIQFDQKIAQGYVTGQLTELPAGPLSVVLGAENRRFSYEVDPGALSGPISGPNVVNRASGRNSFVDFFGEVEIPLLRDQGLADELTVNLSARHSSFKARNQLTGAAATPSKDWTYGTQISYAPFEALRLRATYQRAVRAPNFTELFAGGNSAPQYYDPCSTNSQFRAGNLGRTAAQALEFCRVAQRTAAANTVALSNYVQPPGSQLTINTTGNIGLRPEKADTITFGAVFSSPASGGFLSTVRGSVDYYNIKVKDAIITPDPNSVLLRCFNYDGGNPNFDPTNINCRSLVRSGAQLSQVIDPNTGAAFANSNNGYLKTSGIDTQLSFYFPMPFLGEDAKLSFDGFLSYLIDWKRRDPIAGQPVVDYAGTVGYFGQGLSNGGGASFPRWKGSLSTTLTDGQVALNWRTRYIHSMTNRAALQYAGETQFTGVGSVWYHDASITWNVEEMFFRLGVNNLFNRQPEIYAPNVQSGTDPSLYDVIGRRLFVSAGIKF